MANEENKEVRSQGTYDPVTGKRKVVLGEDLYENTPPSGKFPGSPPTSSGSDLTGQPGYNDHAREVAEAARRVELENGEPEKEGGFFRKFRHRDESEDGFRDTDRGASPVFDEKRDAILADESTRDVPLSLLGEDEATDNRAARALRDKDYAALATESPVSGSATADRERRNVRRRNNLIGILVALVLGALFFFLAPMIQEAIFKTPDNTLIFSPASGILSPRSGVIAIFLGILGLILIFSTLFSKRREETLSRRDAAAAKPANLRRTLGLILLIFFPIGFALLFNFTEFRNDDIRYSSLFNQNRTAAYSAVTVQEIFTEGEAIYYKITTPKNPATIINITTEKLETVKLLDAKLPVSRNVKFSSDAIEKLLEQEIYTNEEVLRLFINKN